MKHLSRLFLIIFCAALLTISCEKEPQGGEDEPTYAETVRRQALEKAQKYLKEELMDNYYYWYDKVPYKAYSYKTDIESYFYSLLYSKDRWSWMMDGQEYIADETGVVSGTYGASFGQPCMDLSKYFEDDVNVVVRFVYPGSPFDKAGITRGCVLTALDNKSVLNYYLNELDPHLDELNELLGSPSTAQPHTFQFRKPDGEILTVSVAAAQTLNTRPCLVKKIFTSDDYPGLTQPVGYFNYLSFKADDDAGGKSMLEDITEAMDYFGQNNVKTLIVDLRYNGGGDSRASNLLVSYLAPESARGKVYVNRIHNDKMSSENESTAVQAPAKAIEDLKESKITLACTPDSPGFEQLYFITGRGSASASEMSLNGLKPLANLKHVGDTTYGKPNGMYVFYYPNDNAARAKYSRGDYSKLKYVFLPICFYNSNGQGQHIPDDGIIPDVTYPDDLYHDFDATEMNIAACLHDVANGAFPPVPKPKTRQSTKSANGKPVIFKSEEDSNENWGRYVVKPHFL